MFRTNMKSWSVTELKAQTFSHTWTIENFHLCPQTCGEYLASTSFTGGSETWQLQCYPNGVKESTKDFIGVVLMKDGGLSVTARFCFSIVNSSLWRKRKKLVPHCSTTTFDAGKSKRGADQFVKRSKLPGLLSCKGRLVIVCKVSIVESTVSTGSSRPLAVPESRLSGDLKRLLESKTDADCQLVVDNVVFQAHRSILSCRSPVFEAMLRHDMEENRRSKIVISDLNEGTVGELLHFIYTGEAPNPEKDPRGVLVAADKYQLDRLKRLCEKRLCGEISECSAYDLLVLGYLHGAEVLKKEAIAFICAHIGKFLKSGEAETLTVVYPKLMEEVSGVLAEQVAKEFPGIDDQIARALAANRFARGTC